MYNYNNSSIIYVSQSKGDDNLLNGLSPEVCEYGNGPFKTLKRALADVGQRRVAGNMRPITIMLTEDYYLTDTLALTIDKNLTVNPMPANGFTICSYGDRKKLVGGIKINNWKKDVFNGVECISAQLPQKQDGVWDFTDFFINGKRASNTRYPKEGTLKALDTEKNFPMGITPPLFEGSKWVLADKSDLIDVEGIEDATITFYHYWVDEHTAVESYDSDSGKLVFKYPSRFTTTTMYGADEHTSAFKYFLENIPTMFMNKNEWYLDRKNSKVYYIPDGDIELENIEAFAPTLKKLIDFSGNTDNKLFDINIKNLEIMCTRGDYVSKYAKSPGYNKYTFLEEPDAGFASDVQSVCHAHGAISFKNAERCSVEDCFIHHIGTHAVEITTGCHNIKVENNKFDDIGAGAVKVFGGDANAVMCDLTSACFIRNNSITNCGKRLAAACGILVCHAAENEITNNEISHLDYSGISVGWVWGYAKNTCYGNIIKGNHIHHIGQGKLSDMGGIYLLGKQQGTVVAYNRIHDVSSAHYGGYGIYTDEGSSYITIENNVVYNTKSESFNHHYGCDNVVRNNIFAFGNGCVNVSKAESHNDLCIENNIFITDGKPIYSGWGCSHGTMWSRNNVIYDFSTVNPVLIKNDWQKLELDFNDWQKLFNQDEGSVVANPQIAGLREFDFTLSVDSPAVKLGFKPIIGFPVVN